MALTTIFLDTFTGANGTPLDEHAPNVAINGAVWHMNAPPEELEIQSNRLVSIDATGGSGSAFNPDETTPLGIVLPCTLTFIARNEFTGIDNGTYVRLDNLDSSSRIEVKIGPVSSVLQDSALVAMYRSSPSFSDIAIEVPVVNDVEHTIVVLLEATQVTVTVDGVPQAPQAFACPTDALYLFVQMNGDESYVDLFQLVSGTENTVKGGFAIDMKNDGFGVVELSYHATAAYADPITDKLNVVIDEYDPPLNISGTAEPTPDGLTIYVFDDLDVEDLLPYRWKGKLNLLPHENTFLMCQVQAEDYANITLNLYGGGVLIDTIAVLDSEEFTLTAVDAYKTLEIEVLGTSRVRRIQVVDDVMELD